MIDLINSLVRPENLLLQSIKDMTQLEFYKSFLFMAELLTAEGLFLATLKRRNLFFLRALGVLVVCFAFSFFFPVVENSPFYMCFMFICLFLFTVVAVKFVFKESWFKLLFCCVAGYTVQHLAYQLNNIVNVAMTDGSGNASMGMYGTEFAPMFSNPFFAIVYFFIYILTYALCYYAFARRLNSETFALPNFLSMALVSAILVVDIILNAVVVHFISIPIGVIVSGLYNVVCCLFGLFLQCQVILSWSLQTRLHMEQVANRFEKERYLAVKEAMDTINIKCHDLKYQEWKYKTGETSERPDAETEKVLAEYSRFTYTGNTALDIVLSEINQQCSKYSIRASYVTEGEALSFMAEEDVYSLFGNLLSNAVEAVSKYPEENRTMGIRIENRCGHLLSISVYNYCGDERFDFKNGLPQTTKKHRELHGFGLKSVRRICDKYDASLDICPDKGFFNVNILMPVPETEPTQEAPSENGQEPQNDPPEEKREEIGEAT